ncbi:MAG TPA: Hsp33 family molecular chaperone HslO [Steroidobacteraceae bacterium]|nr:Hsp33 family molecular chaperone HslO [Steroidobacteraceae bacterium]
MDEPAVSTGGALRRFIFEHHPVRGFWIRLEGAWRELRSYRQYTPAVEALLGEAVSATLLLAATLKFRGTLTLQLAGDGHVKLLVAQCTHEFEVRAVANTQSELRGPLNFRELVGDGRLTVTIESEERATRYQGIVSLVGDSLAACLENYFETSEQLPTRLALVADAARSAGVLIQKMPAASTQGEALAAVSQTVWEEAQSNLQALDHELLRQPDAHAVLESICRDQDCRLFSATAVRFACRCNHTRVEGLLRALGFDEIRSIVAEQGAVTVTCEFCGRPYRFDPIDAERLFSQGSSPDAPPTLN